MTYARGMVETHLPFDLDTLDLLPYGVIVVDRAGLVLYYNKREEEIAGRTQAEVIGRNFFTEVAPCTRVRDFFGRFEAVLGGESTAVFDFVFPFAAGPRHVSISLNGFDHEGQRLCLITVNDKTAQDIVRAGLERAERFRELGEVAMGVAHSFNNLLTAVYGGAQMLADDVAVDDPRRSLCEGLLQASHDGMALVERIRRMAARAPHDVEPPPIELAPVVDDCVAWVRTFPVRRGAAPTVTTRSSASPLRAAVASSALREALLNLLRNALDAVEGHPDPRVTVTTRREGDEVVIEVADNGPGIDPDIERRLFQPFFTTKGERGTGLGLPMAYTLMQRRGGTVTARSEPARGAAFCIRLPAA